MSNPIRLGTRGSPLALWQADHIATLLSPLASPRAVERVAGFDDLVNSILQARLAQVSVDQNNDMRMIAAWAAIAAVPTVVAGIFGMNFAVMPGLSWQYGFTAVIVVMAVAAVVLYRRFKKAGWL